MAPAPDSIIYDGDCGMCELLLRVARRVDVQCAAVKSQALSDADLGELGLTREETLEASWYVTDDAVLRGHESIAAALRTSPQLCLQVIGTLISSRLLRPISAAAYDWVAHNRPRLPGGTPACALSDGSLRQGPPRPADAGLR